MPRIVTITGNRNTTNSDLETIKRTMELLLRDNDLTAVYFGGARGADTIALKEAHLYKHGFMRDDVQLIVVVPDTILQQPVETRVVSKTYSDQLIELKQPITANDGFAAYHIRNRFMVDRATNIIAFWNGEVKSGTWTTVRYAKAREKQIEIVTIEGTD